MKKSFPLSYRTKKRRINEELESHYKSLQDNSFFIDDAIDNNINNSPSNLLHTTENNIVESNNIPNNNDFVSDDSITNNINKSLKHSLNTENVDDLLNINTLIDDDFIFNTEKSFCFELADWSIQNKIPHTALNSLLLILRKHKCFSSLPKDARTILHTKPIELSKMRIVDPGKYYHFGIENGINRYFSTFNVIDHSSQEINLVIGIDGLPISKSNSNQFWPILAYMRSKSKVVFPVGLYFGTEKPHDSKAFLKDFIDEAKHLVDNGLVINNNIYKILLDVFCCDTPAKAFILKIKGHNGFSSCTRCEIEGEYKENRLCFPYCDMSNREAKRTHYNYVNQTDINHHLPHTNISRIVEISGVNVVTSFSLDYMHLVTLGVMKKLLLLWIKGPLSVRLPSSKIKQLSNLSLSFKSEFPCEFSRKPRSLIEVARWKATEFRSFLLYIGPVILKNIVSDDCLKNFMALNIAMIILLSPDCRSFIQYADDLLNYFVETFEQIYGQYLVSSNVHGLIHLVDDYKQYGPLDNCSAFPFENYMKVLKSMLRQPNKPLEQVVMRYNENGNFSLNKNETVPSGDNGLLLGPHTDGPLLSDSVNPQFTSLVLNSFKIKCKIDADSYFISKTNEIIKLINIAHSHNTGAVVLIGRKFEIKEIFYDKPIRSSCFGIYIVKQLSTNLYKWTINDIQNKVMILSCNKDCIAIPLLHSS